jgi:hypothetical protein
MSMKKSLEQPVVDAVIRHAYALREDEETALLSAFLSISYRIHLEAVEYVTPGGDFDHIIAMDKEVIETPSPAMAEETLIDHSAAVSSYHESLIAWCLRYIRNLLRHREHELQEEEEIALFNAIEGVADQVHREAFENELSTGVDGSCLFAAAYERASPGHLEVRGMPIREVISAREGNPVTTRKHVRPRDKYIALMDEELKITRGIIDRNRALSQGYLKAHAF